MAKTKRFPATLLVMRGQRAGEGTFFDAMQRLDDIGEDFDGEEVAIYGLLRVEELQVTKRLVRRRKEQ